ncbi:putative hydrophobic protein (TIGR00271 family) [Dysgonomonadaceae bacterium PH5-43]|nr:putative hydrophobic protein (TIGR00271 family) [Dysgonomonadaceae bacterium PH5-43]
MKNYYKRSTKKLKLFFLRKLDIRNEKEDDIATIESIKKGVEFTGTNLWVLIFAILIASLGLNVNSTAVIIGAMLISPLMGPIMGFGLGLGINDFDMFKKSVRNFAIATFYSVVASTLFFIISPISEAQSELLARTQPTIYDVMIAFFGGCAGIIASCSKSKGNVIPGVAIATALMPPLCTAGFGLATGNLSYFIGAFYLYFINTVFIALATFFVVKILKFPKVVLVDKKLQKKVSRIITAIVICTMIPSSVLTYNMIQNDVFENQANNFIHKELTFPETHIINKELKRKRNEKEIKIITIGKTISEQTLERAKNKLENYGLKGTELIVQQGVNNTEDEIDVIKDMVMKDFYQYSQNSIDSKNLVIDSLRQQLKKYEEFDQLSLNLVPEFKALFPKVKEASISRTWIVDIETNEYEPTTLVYLRVSSPLTPEKRENMITWLKARTNSVNLKLIEQ